MAIFKYTGFDTTGKSIQDYIESSNMNTAIAKLKANGVYVKDINEDIVKRDRRLFPILAKYIYRISRKEIGLFAKQLGTLLGAGISLDAALKDIAEQTTNVNFKNIIIQMKENVLSGASLSDSLAEHSDVFPSVYKSMVHVGEATGSYEKTLNRLADLEEKNSDLKQKAVTAFVYPSIMLLISLGVIIFLLTSVVPQIEVMYDGFGGELPLPTKIVLSISSVFQNFWYLILLGIPGMIVGVQYWKKNPKNQIKWEKMLLKIPLLGQIFNKVIISRFARNLGTLLDSKVQLLQSLNILSHSEGSLVFKNELQQSINEIKEGQSLKHSIKDSIILPAMVKGMLAAGEASDQLSSILLKISDIIESELDTAIKGLTNALEPLMIVFMGAIIGGIMVSVMLPLYKMTELIK